jgi:hypothetical protein
VLEKKFPNTYKLELLENLKIHPIFHLSLLKLVTYDASRPPPNLIDNKPKFEMEVMFKSRQLRGWEQKYLVKWKGFHPIEPFWVNESDMKHAQKTIKKFHNRSAKNQRNIECDEDITFY